jgi:cystathionine beta-synthase
VLFIKPLQRGCIDLSLQQYKNMQIKNNILETIGHTPMVKINKVKDGHPALVLGKVETFNPGNSIKDRMALKMIEDAEKAGKIKPGGTIIECTSGNTGMGLAIASCVKGYKCIFTTSDKQSKEKIDLLKAHGADVIVCPTNVEPTDPRSYYSIAEKLSKEIPNSFWCNQYDNLSNTQAHYESTGPEIWDQTDGKITHLIVGVGTGGTVSGTAKYLKEKNPNIKVWGIDTYGSVFKKYKETGIFDEKEIYPYITEGIGEDILPQNVNFDLIDHFEKVTDKDAALAARRLAREEGILLGYSGGSAMAGFHQLANRFTADDVVVIIFHDHGSRYIGKIFNDDWMRERGFLDVELKVRDVLNKKVVKGFISVDKKDKLKDILKLMKANDISQLPVSEGDELVGSITESKILEHILNNPLKNIDTPAEEILDPAFPVVSLDMPVKELNKYMSKANPAVIVKDNMGGLTHRDTV